MEERRSKLRVKHEKRLEQIISYATKEIETGGFEAIQINKIIADCDLSRGTFFSMIPSKEALIAHLAIKGFNHILQLFEQVKKVPGNSREKLLHIYIANLIFLKRHGILNECILDSYNSTARGVLPYDLKVLLDKKMNDIIGHIQWCIELGIYNKELIMPERLSTFDFAFYIWAGQFGVTSLSRNTQSNIIDASKKYKYYTRQGLDALPWHPTAAETNFDELTLNFLKKYFKEDMKDMELVTFGK